MWLGAFPRLRRLTHMVRLFGRCLLQRSLPIFVEGLMTQGAIGGTTMTWTSAESMLTESECGELSEYREAEFGESVGEWAAPSRRVLPARLVGVVSAFELGVFHPVNGLPSWLYGLLWSVMQLGSLAAVFEVAGIALIARRSRMAVELLAGGPADLLLRERPEGHHRPGTPAEMMSDVVFHGDPAQGLGCRPGTPRCRPRWPRWRCRSWRGHRSPVPAGAVPAAATSPAGSRPTSAASPLDLGVTAAPVSGGDQHVDRNSMVPQACRSG